MQLYRGVSSWFHAHTLLIATVDNTLTIVLNMNLNGNVQVRFGFMFITNAVIVHILLWLQLLYL